MKTFKEKLLIFNSLLSGDETKEEIEFLSKKEFGTELDTVTIIDLHNCGLTELPKCLPYFKKLVDLYCFNNKLSSIDVSKNINLEYLDCDDNQLSCLNISNNSNLQFLICSNNKLTRIDVSKNIKLIYFSCRKNNLKKLDISKNVKLKKLNCSDNNFKYADKYSTMLEISDFRKNVELHSNLKKQSCILDECYI